MRIGTTPITNRGVRVLVLDDNQDAADSFAVLLRFLGLEVRTAYSGPAALEVVRLYDRPLYSWTSECPVWTVMRSPHKSAVNRSFNR